jgi:hypothetical protein
VIIVVVLVGEEIYSSAPMSGDESLVFPKKSVITSVTKPLLIAGDEDVSLYQWGSMDVSTLLVGSDKRGLSTISPLPIIDGVFEYRLWVKVNPVEELINRGSPNVWTKLFSIMVFW